MFGLGAALAVLLRLRGLRENGGCGRCVQRRWRTLRNNLPNADVGESASVTQALGNGK